MAANNVSQLFSADPGASAASVSPVVVIISIILAIAAVAILLGLLSLLLLPARDLLISQKGRKRLRRATLQLAKVDSLLESDQAKNAVGLLRPCVLLDRPSELTLVERYREHNQGILSRCVLISEALGTQPNNLAEVEQLFNQRAELCGLLLRAEESFKSLSSRRAKEGKTIPSWSKTDYQSRVVQIENELEANVENLRNALEQLFLAVRGSDGQPIVYH